MIAGKCFAFSFSIDHQQHAPATVNPDSLKNNRGTHHLITICSVIIPIPGPIPINSLCTLREISLHNHIVAKARETTPSLLGGSYRVRRLLRKEGVSLTYPTLNLLEAVESPSDKNQIPQQIVGPSGPNQPSPHIWADCYSNLSLHIGPPLFPDSNAPPKRPLQIAPSKGPQQTLSPPQISAGPEPEMNQLDMLSTHMDTEVLVTTTYRTPSAPNTVSKTNRFNRGTHPPTRRSPRLQQKQGTPSLSLKSKQSDKAKSKISKLPFDMSSSHSPIDASSALAILQASGLKIDKSIEDLVQQAIKDNIGQDTETETDPTTPLHDHIPPLNLPGVDVML